MRRVHQKSNKICPKCIFHEQSLDQITLRMVINLRRLNFGCMLYRLHWFQVYIKNRYAHILWRCRNGFRLCITVQSFLNIFQKEVKCSKSDKLFFISEQQGTTGVHAGLSCMGSSIAQKTGTYWYMKLRKHLGMTF